MRLRTLIAVGVVFLAVIAPGAFAQSTDPTPTVVACNSACTVTLSISFDFPPFNLSESDGGAIASAILVIWGVGWAFRVLTRQVKTSDGNSSTEED